MRKVVHFMSHRRAVEVDFPIFVDVGDGDAVGPAVFADGGEDAVDVFFQDAEDVFFAGLSVFSSHRVDFHQIFSFARNWRILFPISLEWVSSAKWPASRRRMTAFGRSFWNALAPAGMKETSFFPQMARSGG